MQELVGGNNKMSWIKFEDRTPGYFDGVKKFRVKIIEGSIKPSIRERIVLGKHGGCGFRFLIGDWQKVIEWLEE